MACFLWHPYTTTTGRPRRNPAFSFMKNINSCWAKFTKQASGATKKVLDLNSLKSKSPLVKRPKELFVTLGNNFRHKKRMNHGFGDDRNEPDFGDGGLWQRNILMGDKCQPLDFSGVIYYDNCGKRLSEVPVKSPRTASPLPSYYYVT